MKQILLIIDTDDSTENRLSSNLESQSLSEKFRVLRISPKEVSSEENIIKECIHKTNKIYQESNKNIYGIFVDIHIIDGEVDSLGIKIAKELRFIYPSVPIFNITNKTKDDAEFDAISEATLEDIDGVFVKKYLEKDLSALRFKKIFEKAQIKRSKTNSIIKKTEVKTRDEKDNLIDIAILTALQEPEFGVLNEIIPSLKAIDSSIYNLPDTTKYFRGSLEVDSKKIKMVAASDERMGMASASSLASRMIMNFQPKYIAIVGIAAGIKGKCQIGDILIPEYSWDYGSGKIELDKKNGNNYFYPYKNEIPLEEELRQAFLKYAHKPENLTFIKQNYTNRRIFKSELNLHLGPFASGATVIASDEFVSKIKDDYRKIIGFDMEVYGVFRAVQSFKRNKPQVFAIKSVSDFGDSKKNVEKEDIFQNYAAFTSSTFLLHFIQNELDFTNE